jgi:hypothetical protein
MNATVPAYPLKWPAGTPRTAAAGRSRSPFGKYDWNDSLHNLRRELGLLGAALVTISTNQPIRRDGEPYAQERQISDPGVAVYFSLKELPVCFPCDRWQTIAENIRAITKHIEAMRGMERWGVGKSNQAFAGYKALRSSNDVTDEDWWLVLGLEETATIAQIQDAFRIAAFANHPDRPGGSAEKMQRLNSARDRALAARDSR